MEVGCLDVIYSQSIAAAYAALSRRLHWSNLKKQLENLLGILSLLSRGLLQVPSSRLRSQPEFLPQTSLISTLTAPVKYLVAIHGTLSKPYCLAHATLLGSCTISLQRPLIPTRHGH